MIKYLFKNFHAPKRVQVREKLGLRKPCFRVAG